MTRKDVTTKTDAVREAFKPLVDYVKTGKYVTMPEPVRANILAFIEQGINAEEGK